MFFPGQRTKTIIAVVGGNECSAELEDLARATGRGIAEAGYFLVCGGKAGVMEAACRGAREAGGTTIGILPGDDPSEANPFIDIPIVTAMSHARNAIIVRTADAVIAIGGKYGTLSEIALAKAIDKPVIGLHSWDIEGVLSVDTPQEALRMIEKLLAGRDTRRGADIP